MGFMRFKKVGHPLMFKTGFWSGSDCQSCRYSPSCLSLLARNVSLHYSLPYAKSVPELAEKYTSFPPARTYAKVWLARFELEKVMDLDTERRQRSRKEARGAVEGEDILEIWLWGLSELEDTSSRTTALKVCSLCPGSLTWLSPFLSSCIPKSNV